MAPKVTHVLYEHATGYGLFRVKEFEEIAQEEVVQSVLDLARFNSIVKLVAFMPFGGAAKALDNINCISEGIVHPDLRAFLEAHVPKGKEKKEKSVLGVIDSKLAASISEELEISCMHTGIVPEVLRGIRLHGPKMIPGLKDKAQDKAQLGLGHSYSRSKVKFNINKADNMIIQSINLLDQLDKNINTFSMRIREWYSFHFPELVKIVNDNYLFAKIVTYIGNRKEFHEDKLPGLEEIVMDSAKVKEIYDASRASMGMDISPMDMINVEMFAEKVIKLTEYRKGQHRYLQSKMDQVAPNLSALIGEQVGARLISHAGSLTNLAKYPASTVQILGAEKALFRALKTRGNTPKYGLIFHSTFIGRAAAKNKGRISRNLANKCTLASRIDCFSETPTSVFGEHLKSQVEERLKFYESGEAPRKNVDVMKEAIAEALVEQHKIEKKLKKEKRSSKANGHTENAMETDQVEATENNGVVNTPSEKKKKKKHQEESSFVETPSIESEKKKKKKKQAEAEENSFVDTPSEKKKKKKHADLEEDSIVETPTVDSEKKKKKKHAEVAESSFVEPTSEKKKKNKTTDAEDSSFVDTPSEKKKKKRKRDDDE